MMRLAVAIALMISPRCLAQAPPGSARVVCINPFSGATWALVVDERHGTVDGFAARLGASITWHDQRDGGHYRLDRETGAMSVIFASSTGGYELHDHCRADPGR